MTNLIVNDIAKVVKDFFSFVEVDLHCFGGGWRGEWGRAMALYRYRMFSFYISYRKMII